MHDALNKRFMDWIQWRKVHFPADSVGDKWPIFAYPHESPLTPTQPRTHPHTHTHTHTHTHIYIYISYMYLRHLSIGMSSLV